MMVEEPLIQVFMGKHQIFKYGLMTVINTYILEKSTKQNTSIPRKQTV